MKNPKYVVMAVLVLGAGAGGYFSYKRFSRSSERSDICGYKDGDFEAVEGQCGTEEFPETSAVGDFDGDGREDFLGQLKSKSTEEAETIIWFAGDERPIKLSDFKQHTEDMDDEPINPVSFDSRFISGAFSKYSFEEFEAEERPPEETELEGIFVDENSSGLLCYQVINSESEPWGFNFQIPTGRDFIEHFPCETAGGRELYVFDRPTKRLLIYYSSAYGM